jgi:hypothetical protein
MFAPRSGNSRYNRAMTTRLSCCVLVLLAGAAAAFAAQAPADSKPKPQSNVLTLSGCVTPDPMQRNVFTLTDENDPTVYRLTGTSVKKYIGQRVEVSGIPSKGLKIVGGLYPTPNVAAQAGAIDPARAAVEAQTQGGTAAAGRPTTELRVRSVRTVPGVCPEK